MLFPKTKLFWIEQKFSCPFYNFFECLWSILQKLNHLCLRCFGCKGCTHFNTVFLFSRHQKFPCLKTYWFFYNENLKQTQINKVKSFNLKQTITLIILATTKWPCSPLPPHLNVRIGLRFKIVDTQINQKIYQTFWRRSKNES